MAAMPSTIYETDAPPGAALHVGCYISLSRVIWMTLVSLGIYWFYWMYRTWKQYRDHTGAFGHIATLPGEDGSIVTWLKGRECYPVWHALTQLAPVYGIFRYFEHIRDYKALMQERGAPDNLNLPALTIIVAINGILSFLAGGMRDPGSGWVDDGVILAGYLLTLITIAVTIIVLCWMQSNLNRYWAAVDDRLAQNAGFGQGEIVLIVIGVLLWLSVITGGTIAITNPF